MGRLTADPELRQTASGIASCNFSMAVDRAYRAKDTGEKQVDFIRVTAWRQTAEFMSLLSRGAWIEIQINSQFGFMHHGRSSHEERGLKSPLLWLNLP